LFSSKSVDSLRKWLARVSGLVLALLELSKHLLHGLDPLSVFLVLVLNSEASTLYAGYAYFLLRSTCVHPVSI